MSRPVLSRKFLPLAFQIRNSAWKCENKITKKEKEEKKDCQSYHKPLLEKKFKPVSHVIFNLDGVVIDSEKIIMESHIRYLAKYKKKYSQTLRMKVMGTRELDGAAIIVKELDLPISAEVYAHGVRQYLRNLMPGVKLMPGARNLICHLSMNKIPIALNSSSTELLFKMKTKDHNDIIKRFCRVVLGSDPLIKRGKPEPDHYLVTIAKFPYDSIERSRYLVIEDSYAGVTSAKAAGLQVVLVNAAPHLPPGAAKQADLVVGNLEELDLDDFLLPRLPFGTMY